MTDEPQPLSPSSSHIKGDGGEGGDASVASSGTQQTRFSFYNAQDFVPPPEEPSKHSTRSSSSRYADYEKGEQRHVGQQPSSRDSSDPNTTAKAKEDLDPVQILRSLQEHEQQRQEILSGPSSTSSSRLGGVESGEGAGSAAAPTTSSSSQGSNPYEDAIQEALDLLRKHRYTPRAAGPALDTTFDHSSSAAAAMEHDDEALRMQQQLNELVQTPPNGDDDIFANSAAADLGEAYQAEIEARRKQRQERMARYATRLAELKQESTDATATSSSSTPGHLDADPWSSTPRVENREHEHWNLEQNGVASEQQQVSSQTGSDSEVQRGVERVLLAILERANTSSRGRAEATALPNTSDGSALARDSDSSLSVWTQPVEPGVSNGGTAATTEQAQAQTDELVLAMSDLLGGSTSSVVSSETGIEVQRRIPVPDTHDKPEVSTESLAAEHPVEVENDDDAVNTIAKSAADQVATATEASAVSNPLPSSGIPEGSDIDHILEAVSANDALSDPGTAASHDELDRIVQSASSSEPIKNDGLDEMVRKVLDQKEEPPVATETSPNRSTGQNVRLDDSFDQRVRRILDKSTKGDSAEDEEQTSGDDDEEDDSSEETDSGDDDEETDDSDEESYDDTKDSSDASTSFDDSGGSDDSDMDGVLGPLSKNAGGTTGVVLEADSPTREHVASPILDSLAAAMSMVTSAVSYDEKPTTAGKDRYSTGRDDEEDDADTVILMRTLCAHLLPLGVDQSSDLIDAIPEWDESNPDEAGYRIIRLTKSQLDKIEKAFERMVNIVKRDSERDLAQMNGSDATFERDLQAAEELLDREEKKLKAAEKAVSSAEMVKLGVKPDGDSATEEAEDDTAEADCLEHFPGVKQTGQGEMGDLEYFHLPVIFKSHVTGFEPTKDLFLEAGNVVAGQYLVEGELGSAAFSTAYRCTDLSSEDDGDGHEEVCLKVIKNTKDFFDQSLDEIKILELLRQTGKCHEKCIIEMKTFFYHREHLIIVTELLRQNLFEFGKFIIDNDEEPYFTLSRLSYITRQCLVALDFVHKLGLVHSDVKPENILLASYSRAQVKLIDFGSSCYLTDRQSSYIQSRSYRAPEVVLGLPYDGRIDIWSIGCVVAEMFTGEVTFQNDSIVSMLSRIEAICGPFPRHMIAQGRQSASFFTKIGLLFEKIDKSGSDNDSNESDDENDGDGYCDIFQPKATTLSARLGFDSDLMDRYNSGKKLSKELKRQAMFVDFCRQLLIIDPETRPTAAQALEHPWMKYAATLTEDDIKYPPP